MTATRPDFKLRHYLPAGTLLAGDKSGSEALNRDGFPLPCRFSTAIMVD